MLRTLTTLFFCAGILPYSFAQEDSTQTLNSDDTLNTNTPVFITTLEDLDNSSGGQNVSGMLQSSRDIFANTAGFNFSATRFRIRGYNSDKTILMLNGIPMNDLNTGWGTWYKWGGLNDVTRYSETKSWLTHNPYHFGGLGGYSNVNATATGVQKGHRLSYAATNRAYNHRLMYTYGTGMTAKGWAFAMSFSGRYAREGYVDGTFYEAYSYFMALTKKLNKKHELNLTVLGAPSRRGRSSISVQETYELSGDNYYNSFWGWQTEADGTGRFKRNSRVTDSHMPIIALTHDAKFSESAKLRTSLHGSFGKYGRTALNWYDAPDPRPDYYKKLPSYFASINDPTNQAIAFDNWSTDEGRQIDWDQLYFANSKNLYTFENVNGTPGNDRVGLRAKYIVENRWNNQISGGLSSVFNKNWDKLFLTTGIFAQFQRNHEFKTIDDLLGADYWYDIDQFAEQDFLDPDAAQIDLNNPNRLVERDDVFGYNFYIYNIKNSAFAQAVYQTKKLDFYGSAELTQRSFWREGLYRDGKFPDDSFGTSDISNFINYAVKGGVTYKLSGRQFLTANGQVMTAAPTSRSAFISPRTRDFKVGNLQNEFIYAFDANYILRYPKLKMRLTYYYMERQNSIWSRSFYHDEYNSFVNYVMEGVDFFHQGMELGVDATIWGGLSANGVLALGQHLYNSRPTASIYVDNSAEVLDENKTVYLTNYKMGGMPQSALSVGLRYSGKKYWFAGVNFNYFMDLYLDPNPDRRTAEAVEGFVTNDPQWDETIDQTRLDNGYNMSLFAGKSFKISNYFLNINVNVNNLTNNRSFVTGGFEQLRYDPQNINKFPPRLGYLYGLNYFVMATLRF